MSSLRFCYIYVIGALLTLFTAAQADDLHIKKSMSINGNVVSTTDTSIKGARERNVNGSSVTIRQCDLKRTLTLNEETQTFVVANDPQEDVAAHTAAVATDAQAESEGTISVTTTITDSGERKQMFGYVVRHLKAVISEESSPKACSQVHEKIELDGWYADLAKEQTGCAHYVPPARQGDNCHDRVVSRRIGSGKPGFPMSETITMHNSGAGTTTMHIQTSELTKQPSLPDELFDVPSGYRQVNSVAELNGAPQGLPQASPNVAPIPQSAQKAPAEPAKKSVWGKAKLGLGGGMPLGSPGLGGMPGMPGMGASAPVAAPVVAPQALGPKVPGKIRVGVAPPEAQLGQGSNAGADYSTPIRNAMIALMSGPAVEIAALDSHVPMQVQAEAQQKQCDYVLFSSVVVKHSSGSGFGKFMKIAAPIANMTPMGMMAHGMGGMIASTAASVAAQSAQQQAISQLAGFNGQIKSKDDVTVQYQLVPTGQTTPRVQNALQGKAKSDGEDVLTPLIQLTANTVLTEVSKK